MSKTKCVKAFIIGDPHFQKNTIFEDEMFVADTLILVKKSKPNFVVILGDTLHTHETVDVMAQNVAYKFIKGLKEIAHTYIIIGNHDYINNSQFLTENHSFNIYKEWKGVTIVDRPILRTILDKTFVFCPYVPSGRFLEALNILVESEDMWEMADCIFAHQDIKNAKLNKNGIKPKHGDVWSSKRPPVISGHIHTPQILKNVYFPGSSKQVNFGEADEAKWLWEVVFDDGSDDENIPFTINKLSVNLKNKKVITINVKEIDKIDIISNSTKIIVSGTQEELTTFKKNGKLEYLSNKGFIIDTKKIKIAKSLPLKKDIMLPFMETFSENIKKSPDNVYQAYKEVFKT